MYTVYCFSGLLHLFHILIEECLSIREGKNPDARDHKCYHFISPMLPMIFASMSNTKALPFSKSFCIEGKIAFAIYH